MLKDYEVLRLVHLFKRCSDEQRTIAPSESTESFQTMGTFINPYHVVLECRGISVQNPPIALSVCSMLIRKSSSQMLSLNNP